MMRIEDIWDLVDFLHGYVVDNSVTVVFVATVLLSFCL